MSEARLDPVAPSAASTGSAATAISAALSTSLFLAALAFHASYAFHGIALFDEGLLADGACRVLDGERIGSEAFVPYGPGSYWLLAPCFAVFGRSLFVLRAAMVVVQAAADVALFRLAARRSTIPGALLATALLAVAHGSLHKSFLLLAAVLALAAAAALARQSDAGGAARAGALAGVAFLLRHDAGAFAGVALLAGAASEASPARSPLGSRLLGLAGGFAAVVAPAFLALLAAGLDPRAWWEHEWQRIAVQEGIEVGEAGPALAAALVATPALHAIWGGSALWRRWRGRALEGDAMRIAAALFGLLLLNQARLVPSANHLFQAFAPVALALADLCARRERSSAVSFAGHGVLAAVVAAVTVWAATGRSGPYSGTFRQRIEGAVELDLPAGGVWLEPALEQRLRAVVAAIQERAPPDARIATSPGCPLLAFLAERRLALPYAEPSYYYFDPRFQQEAIAALERWRPPVFVSDGRPAASYVFEDAAPTVARYVASHYRAVETIGAFTVFERIAGR